MNFIKFQNLAINLDHVVTVELQGKKLEIVTTNKNSIFLSQHTDPQAFSEICDIFELPCPTFKVSASFFAAQVLPNVFWIREGEKGITELYDALENACFDIGDFKEVQEMLLADVLHTFEISADEWQSVLDRLQVYVDSKDYSDLIKR